MTDDEAPFWETTPLAQMSREQWESLCDGCGRCCLHKLREDETDEVLFTDVACRLLDTKTCLCTDYAHRQRRVQDCISLTPEMLADIDWLPPTCGYILVRDGEPLPWWHPLVSGTHETVHEAGISVSDRVISEREAGMLEDHVIDWPGEAPRHAFRRTRPPRRT